MSKAGLIILCALISIAVPFLGIPSAVKVTLTVLLGVVIAVLALLAREERRFLLRALSGEHQTDAYTENGAKGYAQGYAQKASEDAS